MKDLRAALAAGEIVFGPAVISGDPSVVEIMGWVGFDYVFIARGGVTTRPWVRLLDDMKSALIRLASDTGATPPAASE